MRQMTKSRRFRRRKQPDPLQASRMVPCRHLGQDPSVNGGHCLALLAFGHVHHGACKIPDALHEVVRIVLSVRDDLESSFPLTRKLRTLQLVGTSFNGPRSVEVKTFSALNKPARQQHFHDPRPIGRRTEAMLLLGY